MKAVTWHGPQDVRVDEVPDPTIKDPDECEQPRQPARRAHSCA